MDGELTGMLLFAAFLWFLVYQMTKDERADLKEENRSKEKWFEEGYKQGYQKGRSTDDVIEVKTIKDKKRR